ncbi:FAD-binding oxidoreductase [Vulcanisaeta distributa]|uniref:FAD linked oxidase domain protein n=1 Tax=Vulcanisaeta distributa (strain DSM 14429 / JCM 11212 / NBRC 100878 / IC-017) TaxID=572478 RepID=E1QUS2_VULDI|nr:FAD-binding oxidoreductase [Vulcanisaeta distributa]ADN49925.1 FAD linked oxidase domain protein [Vulcanisaeta distributa DSM 14429]
MALEAALKGIEREVSNDSIREPTSKYVIDGLMPKVVLYPRDVNELSTMMRGISKEKLSVIPIVNGSKTFIGNIPKSYDVALDLSRVNRVIEPDPEEMVGVYGVSASFNEVQETLRRVSRRLPIDPPLSSRSSIGGVFSCNLFGPLAYTFMTTRDITLRVRAVMPDGTVVRWGTGMIKDVAGYNVKRLFIGSCGSLGIIYEVMSRIAAIPDVIAVTRLNKELDLFITRRLKPYGAIVVNGTMYLRFEGVKEEVEYRLGKLSEVSGFDVFYGNEAEELWYKLTSMDELFNNYNVIIKVVTPQARLNNALRELPSDYLVKMPMIGEAYLGINSIDVNTLNTIRGKVGDLGGYLMILKAPPELKRGIDVWGLNQNLDIMSKLKSVFDPLGIMSPGRFVGGL